jgi:hypothetical protein
LPRRASLASGRVVQCVGESRYFDDAAGRVLQEHPPRSGAVWASSLQLPFACNEQHAVVVLDEVAHGFMVSLDEAGDDLALEAASPCLTTRWPTMNFNRIRPSLMSPLGRPFKLAPENDLRSKDQEPAFVEALS